MVLAFATALAGGVIRDLLIGAVPPASLRNWKYAITAFSAATLVFIPHAFVGKLPASALMVIDSAGLGLFAVAGTEKALEYGMNPFIATLMGTITGVGGGTVRDIFLAQVPTILRADVYATAAWVGAAILILCRWAAMPPAVAATAGGAACFLLRIVSAWRHWNLPHVTNP